MKKPAILAVCVLLLCGGLCHLYLTAQALEVENTARPVPTPVPVMSFSPTIPTTVDTLMGTAIFPFPSVQHTTPITMLVPAPEGTITTVAPSALDSHQSFRAYPAAVPIPFPVAPARTVPDIGKFRLPIAYKLKNIPVGSLIDFLAEEFANVEADAVEAEAAEDAGAISITASLADHRIIRDMLIELEREVAALRSDAANVAEAATTQIVVITNEDTLTVGPIEAKKLLEHMNTLGAWSSVRVALDESTDSLIVAGTAEQIAAIEALIEKLARPTPDSPTVFPVFNVLQ